MFLDFFLRKKLNNYDLFKKINALKKKSIIFEAVKI